MIDNTPGGRKLRPLVPGNLTGRDESEHWDGYHDASLRETRSGSGLSILHIRVINPRHVNAVITMFRMRNFGHFLKCRFQYRALKPAIGFHQFPIDQSAQIKDAPSPACTRSRYQLLLGRPIRLAAYRFIDILVNA